MALTLPKLSLPKLAVPKLSLSKKQAPAVALGAIVVFAGLWFGWQYFAEEPPPPPAKRPQPVTAAKPQAKPLSPAEIEKARDKLVEDVLAATGLKQQLDQLPQALAAGVRQSPPPKKKAAAAMSKTIDDALAEAFSSIGFSARVSADLKKNFDQKRLQALLKDFSTPAAKSMVQAERASATAEERAQFARSPAATQPSAQRADLIKRIDAASRASELAVETASVTMSTLAAGIAGENARKAAAMDKTIEKQRASTAQAVRDATMLNIAYGFKDASDADLQKYAEIYETENSKWLYGLVYAALLEEVKTAATDAGKRIAESAVKPAAKPATTAAKSHGARTGADARACLELATNAAIIKCAEEYR